MTDPDTSKRGPGRPRGMGKVPGSGRRKGTPNRSRVQVLERIEREADPVGFLIRIAKGLQFEAATEAGAKTKEKMYPTSDQRLDACRILARKVLPDQKAVEITPGGAEPFIFQFISPMQAGNA